MNILLCKFKMESQRKAMKLLRKAYRKGEISTCDFRWEAQLIFDSIDREIYRQHMDDEEKSLMVELGKIEVKIFHSFESSSDSD